ncbi:MAG: YkgJ family cysteine cluster protein, partial [Treponema sp.]|nr:YkgJ family cysteine cluster protein [Treponema sp.]
MTETCFYSRGLQFSCKRCSSCCRHSSGYVFLSEKDLGRLASELKMDEAGFISVYCRWVERGMGGEFLSLKEKLNYDCVFWNSGCAVYQSRPLQCRTFPFWESVLSSAEAWEAAGASCPGINSGETRSYEEI